ncbi:hypothetical protein CAPTEDRAFT_206606 [Capitella teleta]|uniref:P2X purinoreceptor 7 intracellular domain-containing protein n=1 Tax=Capitella teleta TaxID=283909 RepID=R7TAP7_CAPTE|nr:hypothetical protein CAPTEDRAFT_206606 [Capitella teleta]|eukprot:ELT88084.1 hypothetical protein CAPTEDRAFT_206606 [Capitella teleta]
MASSSEISSKDEAMFSDFPAPVGQTRGYAYHPKISKDSVHPGSKRAKWLGVQSPSIPDQLESDSESETGQGEGYHRHSRSETPESLPSESRYGREAEGNWCTCGQCDAALLTNEKECLCCQEIPKTAIKIQPNECIVGQPEFNILCLETVVLRNVLVALNHTRMDAWKVDNPSNRSLRWAAYRQFTWWIHSKLGIR